MLHESPPIVAQMNIWGMQMSQKCTIFLKEIREYASERHYLNGYGKCYLLKQEIAMSYLLLGRGLIQISFDSSFETLT